MSVTVFLFFLQNIKNVDRLWLLHSSKHVLLHLSGYIEYIAVFVFMFYSLCSQETLPVTFQACVITKDCDVTEWSKWSACTKECYDPTSPKAVWTRTRKVTQFPVGGGIDCPELEEKEPCTPQSDVVPPCIT